MFVSVKLQTTQSSDGREVLEVKDLDPTTWLGNGIPKDSWFNQQLTEKISTVPNLEVFQHLLEKVGRCITTTALRGSGLLLCITYKSTNYTYYQLRESIKPALIHSIFSFASNYIITSVLSTLILGVYKIPL